MKYAFQSDIGNHRDENQDYVGVFKNKQSVLFSIVADGIGGRQGGDVASEMAVSHLGYLFQNTDFDDVTNAVNWLQTEVTQENDEILETAQKYSDLNGMGTTIVVTIILKNQFIVAHLGDSRCYLFKGNELKQLTSDHSLVNELIKKGKLSPEEARNHPQKNIITKTLGISNNSDIDVHSYVWKVNDQLLLCTDGLTNMVTDQTIANVLAGPLSLEKKCLKLIELANQAGGRDNVTVLIIQAEDEVNK
ncbi:Stp1/IreP family PP2C-type Ser/Thr phosphatase [Pediococcus inopinatus]|uniref:Stp1/IreP family PP2C-type Ser/Thr phosphatase n=1 Tax=Pediococcus inopinatus TaxID=114090 RepID=A0ABZ0Q6D0_9LACO|nr:Stp1/IreP family PP2C-type Ser/Thr phosphatase [Pediococcus inopinatus]AVK99819.1 protein phosphatase [Pediococcus inopinatus]KRN63286.1 serine threonine specific protein phosphatase [Pediococcus inopinatus]WPC17547.1 Stp1/IreP family PP2C-type Ser/Thr phosphatase [Pediococcus inopinatus]WPC18920.1 Stp1/IreP family PP2C-type Ser/Thr phosphatase [Pediococcus inopinatus]WPC22539.1 Stp1/IreP family PP2C-type Ser/Thr phosphatase [Pediococcus inopinatus]